MVLCLRVQGHASSLNKCKLMDWSKKDEVVAEGRWQSKDPKALVNGLPLGPNAVKVFVDVVLQPEIFLWRSTPEMTYLEESLMSYVAWPANEVVFEKNTDEQISSSTDQAVGAATRVYGRCIWYMYCMARRQSHHVLNTNEVKLQFLLKVRFKHKR